MTFPPAPPPLKPYDPSPRSAGLSSGKGALDTSLTPADLSGIIARPKDGTAPEGVDPEAFRRQETIRQSQQWVAQTFFGTLLRQMRSSPFRSDLFEGGRGGQAYSELYHQKLVEHMSRGAGKDLVRSIVRRLEANAAYQKQRGEGINAGGAPAGADASRVAGAADTSAAAPRDNRADGATVPPRSRPGTLNNPRGYVSPVGRS